MRQCQHVLPQVSYKALFGPSEPYVPSCDIPHLPWCITEFCYIWRIGVFMLRKCTKIQQFWGRRLECWEVTWLPSPLNVSHSRKLMYEPAKAKHYQAVFVNGKAAHSKSLALPRSSFNRWLGCSSDLKKQSKKHTHTLQEKLLFIIIFWGEEVEIFVQVQVFFFFFFFLLTPVGIFHKLGLKVAAVCNLWCSNWNGVRLMHKANGSIKQRAV